MHRRLILTFSAIAALGLGLLPGSGFSQQKTLKEQLVGAWTLVSYQRIASGTKQTIANPKGVLMFDAVDDTSWRESVVTFPSSNLSVEQRQGNLPRQLRTSSPPTLALGRSVKRIDSHSAL
jgi:hypothetical protein